MLDTYLARAKEEIAFLEGGPFPVDVNSVAVRYGITAVEEDDLGRLDAFLMPIGKEKEYLAVLNSTHTPTRKRFSLAHEIGHILLVKQGTETQFRKPSCGGSASDPIERACNQLAAEILMPTEPFKWHAEIHGWGISASRILSRMFDTSLESTLRRIVFLSDSSLSLIKWRLDSSMKPHHIVEPITSNSEVKIIGFDRLNYLEEIPSLHRAYTQNGQWEGLVDFEVSLHKNSFPEIRPFTTESIGVGKDANRVVFSLARIQQRTTEHGGNSPTSGRP